MSVDSCIKFYINGDQYEVKSNDVTSDTTLLEYLRSEVNLRGTKYMCQEGGCGACIVAVSAQDPHTGLERTFSINSCLVHVASCHQWKIHTIEGIGNRLQGYHPIQRTLAEYNGTQCGHCSPGWVMQMYSLVEGNKDLTQQQVEDLLGSNICRCTGYRPILDAFKTFAKDGPTPKNCTMDIEDLGSCKGKNKCKDICKNDFQPEEWCVIRKEDTVEQILAIDLHDDRKWFRVNTVKDIFDILDKEGTDSYMLVGGDTGRGAYPIFAHPKTLIDVSGIQELKLRYVDQNLIIGAGNSLTDTMDCFLKMSNSRSEFRYLDKLYQHLELVAHVPVRNVGTVAGNLMVKHQNPEFASDVFLLFETIGAILSVGGHTGDVAELTMGEFLKIDMTGKVILNVKLPPLSEDHQLVTYKIMPRALNAHAQVNAGFLYKINHDETVIEARIVLGGLSSKFTRAHKTEEALKGHKLFTNETLQMALKVLQEEIIADEMYAQPSAKYRKKLALGLFYKGLLHLCPKGRLDRKYVSGTIDLRKSRPLSKGQQSYDTNPILWPDNEPMPKVEALIQCAGEAMYSEDIPTLRKEVFAAFVLTKVARGQIDVINPEPALKLKGVIAFYSAKDIPGNNLSYSTTLLFVIANEVLLCDGDVKYYDQPLGIIVAESHKLATRAAKLVEVKYKNVKPPVLTIREAQKDPRRVNPPIVIPPTDRGTNIQRVIRGSNAIYQQYAFHMEIQNTVAYPTDDGIEVNSATQWPDAVQELTALVLKIPKNTVNVVGRRIGGGFGAKISRANMVAVAAALVSYLLNRPCRHILDIETNMRALGKRLPSMLDFEAGVDDRGRIQYLEYAITDDNGYIYSETLLFLGVPIIKNCYDRRRWNIQAIDVMTDNASNSWLRAPGTVECVAMTEHIMERISYELNLDPVEVRRINLDNSDEGVVDVIDTIIRDSEYNKRKAEVEEFNSKNRWKKRGLRFVPINWPPVNSAYFHVLLSVYHGDGTVAITHGGIEMGQGLNTKAIQACAYTLGISKDKVKVKASTSSSSPNSIASGGSITSESVCFGIIKCCQLIMERFAPLRAQMPEATWEQLVERAYRTGINLQTSYLTQVNDQMTYRVPAAAVAEVELDILTGEHDVLRVDLLEDAGLSLNPELDVGQVEGAFIFGLGYWTSEHFIYNEKGECETNRTWDYHVPGHKDIPIDFRIQLRRNSFNPAGVLGSKATGEPATCLGIVVAFALRQALASSREDTGFARTQWFQLDGPYTNESMILAADVRTDEFLFY